MSESVFGGDGYDLDTIPTFSWFGEEGKTEARRERETEARQERGTEARQERETEARQERETGREERRQTIKKVSILACRA